MVRLEKRLNFSPNKRRSDERNNNQRVRAFPRKCRSIRIDDELILLNPLRRLMADGNYKQVLGRLAVANAEAGVAASQPILRGRISIWKR